MERVELRGASAILDGSGPERGPIGVWSELGLRRHQALVVEVPPAHGADWPHGPWPRILWIGEAGDPGKPATDRSVDLDGRLLTPGLVDAHTHAVFAGDRSHELMRRLAGDTYQQIAAAGGGILHTVAATRAASVEQLHAGLRRRLDEMARWGTRIVEVKTGYGLDLQSEQRCLDAIVAAGTALAGSMQLVATAMPAHALPLEFQGDGDAYVHAICDTILPAMAAHPAQPRFVDVFVEAGYFDVAQAERIWQAAQDLGVERGAWLGLKAHVDEFEQIGGLPWALAAGATSVEHLLVSDADDLAALCASETVAVALPLVSVFLGQPYAAMRTIVDGGGLLAIATDCNPGSSMSSNLMLAAQMGVFGGKLTPAEALRAITRGGARALGCPDGYDGTLQVGGPFCASAFEVEGPDALFYELGAPPRAWSGLDAALRG